MNKPPPPENLSLAGPSISVAEASDPQRPRRVLGFRDLVLFYVVTGISLRWIATAAAAGPSAIAVWIGAWLLFYTPLALSVIELSSRYPNEGGLYVSSPSPIPTCDTYSSAAPSHSSKACSRNCWAKLLAALGLTWPKARSA